MKDNLKKILYLFLVLVSSTMVQANDKATLKANDFLSQNTLHDAVRSGDIDLVEYLVKQGIELNEQDDYGYTPLHLAVRLHDLNITKYLLDVGANPNTHDTYKDTPLLDATRNDDTKIAKLLICNNSDRNVEDTNSISTLQYSAKNKNKEIANLLRADDLKPYCQSEIFNATFDDINSTDNALPKICGTANSNVINKVIVTINDQTGKENGIYDTLINDENRSWCVSVTKEMADGNYTLNGKAINLRDKFMLFKKDNYIVDTGTNAVTTNTLSEIKNDHDIAVDIPGLYNALTDEFKDDFEKWDATLDENTLVFRFNDPSMLFGSGNTKLKDDFKIVLDNFFPRYVSVVHQYKDKIDKIYIEGHSSSEYNQGADKETKYELNKILSTKRANAVLSYASLNTNENLTNNIVWIITTFRSKGYSSSQLIYNLDGTENKERSRRVDFRIITKEQK